eukprot:4636076-Alexandrium_andersonii.AAC.1
MWNEETPRTGTTCRCMWKEETPIMETTYRMHDEERCSGLPGPVRRRTWKTDGVYNAHPLPPCGPAQNENHMQNA